ncbi:hypothetical protein T11_7424 [Trichinella zimbabwensis]|uniref:Uncharacterized protein n=1 Tax=Trichinella zimbabwensis TaxID=268475 RepID=A0A0V1GY94_9BILA|nr:hypothetical protein T11_7424 [Trichinella zimbabwensis]
MNAPKSHSPLLSGSAQRRRIRNPNPDKFAYVPLSDLPLRPSSARYINPVFAKQEYSRSLLLGTLATTLSCREQPSIQSTTCASEDCS